MSLLNRKKGKDLGFSDFVSSAVRGLSMPYFSLPIILLGAGVGYATDLTLKPLLVGGFENAGSIGAAAGPIATASGISIIAGIFIAVYGQIYGTLATSAKTGTPTIGEAFALIGQRGLSVFTAGFLITLALAGIFIVGLIVVIGGAVAVTAGGVTTGTIGEAFALIAQRGISVLAAALLVTLATAGIFIVGLIVVIGSAVAVNAGGMTTGLFILFLVVFIYLSMRLGQAGWFAADGMGAIDSIKASWSRTQGHLLKILFWSIGGAFVFAAVGALIGLLTSSLPTGIGSSIGTGVGLVFTYASGSVLYRRITAK